MTKRIIYSLSVILFFFQTGFAQSDSQADKIVSDVLNSVNTTAFKTNFKLDIRDKANNQNQSTSGTITIKGSKFYIDMMDMKAWYNGKTQWAFIPQNNEVSITEPTEKELSETNPIAILSGFKTKSFIRFSKKKSNEYYIIEMIPKVKTSDILNIEIQVNKNTHILVSIKLTAKKGNTTLLTLNNFQKNIKVTDNYFVFNASKYTGVIENDLR